MRALAQDQDQAKAEAHARAKFSEKSLKGQVLNKSLSEAQNGTGPTKRAEVKTFSHRIG